MVRTFFGLASLIAIAALAVATPIIGAPRAVDPDIVYDGIPESTAATDRLDAYLGAREARLLGWTPKGQLLIATRFGEVDELHLVDRPQGDRRQITFAHEPIRTGAFCPDPNRGGFFYEHDSSGFGFEQLYYQKLGEPAPRLLTDGKSVNGGGLWSNNGRTIAFWTTARDSASHDIDLVEPESGALPRLVLGGDHAEWIPLDWSPDDSKLLVLRRASEADATLFLVELDSGKRRELDPGKDKVRIVDARFSRDGQGVYLISDRDGDFTKLRYLNLFTAERSDISTPMPWDIEGLALSRDGHYLAYVSNEGGVSRLHARDLRTHQDVFPPQPPVTGVIEHLSFDADSHRLAFDLAGATRPRDVYVLDFETNRLEAWTESETGPVPSSELVTPRLVAVPTFDRTDGKARTLATWVFEPPVPGPYPVLIVLHDGLGSEFRPVFDPWLEYVVKELHFAVIAPNVRGSTGYGRTFAALDDGVLREDTVKDVGALLVWLGLQQSFDAKHVVIAGQGSGGSLALAALVNYGERLQGAVDLGGITDFVSFLATTAAEGQDLRRAEYGDERQPDMSTFLRSISPLTNADRITRPVLVVHGRNDRAVPFSQAQQLVYRLRGLRGGHDAVWFLQATRAGERLERASDRDALYQVYAQFLQQTLR